MSSDDTRFRRRPSRRRPLLAVVVALATVAMLGVLGNLLFGVSEITAGFVSARIGMMQTANAQRDMLVFHRMVLRFAIGGSLSDAELRRGFALQQLSVLAANASNEASVKQIASFQRELRGIDLRALAASPDRRAALVRADRRLAVIDLGLKVIHDEGTLRFQKVTDAALAARVRTQRLLAALILLAGVTAAAWALQARQRSRGDLEVAYDAAQRELDERKQTEVALRQSVELQSKVIETSTDLMALVSLTGGIIFVSPAIETILGHLRDAVVGESWADLVHPDDAGSIAVALGASAARERPEPIVARVRHAAGHWVAVEGIAAPIIGADGEVEMLLVICRDVTERRRSEEARATLEQQLHHSQKLEAVGRLAGGIAHDFNNLLLAISGYSDLALTKLPTDSPARGDVNEVRTAADRAAALTNQLLAYSRKQVLQPRIVDLNEIVSGVEKMLRRVLGEDVALVTSLTPDIATTRADAGQLEQVIMNLAINARDAMPVGGRLEISTSNAELDERHAARHIDARAGAYVKIRVSDTGEGMDSSTLEQIFEPFFTTKPQGKGTGLGLATVYGIVTQTGGHIVAASEPGLGTVFDVYLPRVWGEVDTLDELPEAAGPAEGETVLLVEDEDVVRTLLQTILEGDGYRVLTAPSGGDALAVAARHDSRIDVLVTDVVMPGMSGRQVAERLRELRPSLSVLFVSGYTEEAIANHGVLGDRAGFLQKPFNAAQLSVALRDVLDAQRVA